MINRFLKLITLFFLIVTFGSCDSSDDNDLTEELEEVEVVNGAAEVVDITEESEMLEVTEPEDFDNCGELSFESRVFSDGGVFGEFVADRLLSTPDSNAKYVWEIDGNIVANETVFTDNEDNHVLIYEFTENDSYEVTLSVETPACPTSRSYTKILIVEEEGLGDGDKVDYCAEVKFESRIFVDGGLFGEFNVEEGIISDSDVVYVWTINGNPVANKTVFTNNEDNHLLIYNFEVSGSYEVTVSVDTPECPDGVTYTETIDVDLEL